MDDKEFYLDAIRDVVPEHKEEQIQDVFYSFLELEHLYDSAIELVKAQRIQYAVSAKSNSQYRKPY